MAWIRIEDSNIKGINGPISLENIEHNKLGIFLGEYDNIIRDDLIDLPKGNIQHKPWKNNIWYKESRQYLLDNGINCCELQLPDDACEYHKLFWNENLFKMEIYKNTCFSATIEPILLTVHVVDNSMDDSNDDSNDVNIFLWRTNAVANMSYRGCALQNNKRLQWGNKIKYVKPVYKGTIKREIYAQFTYGVHVPKPKRYKFEPLPSKDFLKKQIIDKRIKKWNVHDCSICNYKCGFIFDTCKQDNVTLLYDCGCYCLYQPPRTASFEQVINHMQIQSNLDVINEYKLFWGIT